MRPSRPWIACRFWLALALSIPCCRAEDFAFFEKRIRPVLVENCYECHSTEVGKSKGGLLLDSREALLTGGDSGPAIIPGKPAESLLLKAIRHEDKDLQMPPEKERLPSPVIADFETWIASGAPDPRESVAAKSIPAAPFNYAAHRRQWPFAGIQPAKIPAVQNSSWPKADIDSFILARLEEQNLTPAAPAEKRALLRRATYDLTGLPPTIEELRAFLDDESPNAFEKVIDRLLASPHYGERWGRHWLDVVRYADSLDSRGIGGDGDIAEAYRYRDWVVQAFNNDMPYDEFVRQQIAGDILPAPGGAAFNTNGLLATGVYAIGEWGTGDADKEKMLTDIVDDQIDVTGRAFLGMTLACARCHDHKFDPISAEDYYGLAGIFFSSRILPNPGVKTAGSPVLRIPIASREAIAERAALQDEIKALEVSLREASDLALSTFARQSVSQTARALIAASEYRAGKDLAAAADEQGVASILVEAWLDHLGWGNRPLFDRFSENVAGIPGVFSWKNKTADNPSLTLNSTAQPVTITTLTLPARGVAVHPSPRSGAGVSWKSPVQGAVRVFGSVADADDKCGDGIRWSIHLRSGDRYEPLAAGEISNGGNAEFTAPALNSVAVRAGDELELIIAPKGEYTCDTTTVSLSIAQSDTALQWDLTRDLLANPETNPAGPWSFYEALDPGDRQKTIDPALDRFLAARDLPTRRAEAWNIQSALIEAGDAAAESATNILSLHAKLTDPQDGFWKQSREQIDRLPARLLTEVRSRLARIAELRSKVGPPFPVAHGFQEGGTPETPYDGFHDARIHVRGRYDRLGDVVPRRFPIVLAGENQPPITSGSGRAELARWIASPDNPLTARVMANRIWQYHFGEGIVRTPNNFGKLGTPPTHPELLDFLAVKFIGSGWSIKAMHKMLMLSATYQQSSAAADATLTADPDNLLYGRMNRRRLDAEEIRDTLLAAAGRLNLTLAGRSVRDLSTDRRTLYVMTVRSDRATYKALFDAADPAAIIEKRTQSTVAPQALWLMNHPFALEQAETLAARAASRAEPDSARIPWLYEALYARLPSEHEIAIGLGALESSRAEFNDEIPAWTLYCQTLLWANEFVYLD